MVTPSKDAIEAELQMSFPTYEAALAEWYARNPISPEEYVEQAESQAEDTSVLTGVTKTFPTSAATAPDVTEQPAEQAAPLEEGYVYGIDATVIPSGARFEKELPIQVVHEPSGKVVEEFYGSQVQRQETPKQVNTIFLDPITEAEQKVAQSFGSAPAAWSYQDRSVEQTVGIFVQGLAVGIATLPYELAKLPRYVGGFMAEWEKDLLYPAKAGITYVWESGKEFAKRPFYVGGQIAGMAGVTYGAAKVGSAITGKMKAPIKETVIEEISANTYRKTTVSTKRGKPVGEIELTYDIEPYADFNIKGTKTTVRGRYKTSQENVAYQGELIAGRSEAGKYLVISKKNIEQGFLPNVETTSKLDFYKFEPGAKPFIEPGIIEPVSSIKPPKPSTQRRFYKTFDEPKAGLTTTAVRSRTGTTTLMQEQIIPQAKVKAGVISAVKTKSDQALGQKVGQIEKQMQVQTQRSAQMELQLSRTKQAVRQKQKQFYGVASAQESKQTQNQLQKQLLKQSSVIAQDSIVSQKVSQKQISNVIQKSELKTLTSEKTKTKPTPTTGWSMIIDKKGFRPKSPRITSRKKPRQVTKYTPSVAAWAGNIKKKLSRAERKAKFTGYEVRPIPLDLEGKSKKKSRKRRRLL